MRWTLLCMTKKLVEAHGGVLHAASDGPGKGALFEVVFPIA